MRRLALAVLVVACGVGEAGAHGRSVSHSRWRMTATGASVEVRLAARDLAVRGIGDPAAYATARLVLTAGGLPCRAGPARTLPSAAGWVRLAWEVECDGAPDRMDNHLFMDGPSARLHFARLERTSGAAGQRVFGPSDVTTPLLDEAAPGAPEAPSLVRYVALGIEHIVTGWDHLAFLAGLLVLAGTVRDVIVLATGFTVAHSVTLAAAVLGLARPDGAGVEALIGFSILLVATENVWLAAGRGWGVPSCLVAFLLLLMALRSVGYGGISETTLTGLVVFSVAHFGLLEGGRNPARLRVAVAFGFGLVHGFGFAGILREAALAPGAIGPALFGFNAGVELGQLGAIVIAWPALHLLRRAVGGDTVGAVVSAALAGLGTFWFVDRAFGA